MRKIGKADESRRCRNHISGNKIESLLMDTIKELFLSPERASDRPSDSHTRREKHIIIRFKIPLDIHLEGKYMENEELFADDEGGKGSETGGKNISSAIGKVLGFLKKKYTLSCRSDHEKSKTHSKRMGFY